MMSSREAFQQLDPLGTLSGRPLILVVAAGIPVYATVMTWLNRFDIDYPVVAVAALALVLFASAVIVYGSSPLRAPFAMPLFVLVTGSVASAALLSAISMWHSNAYIRDDWGPVAIGLAMLALTQYRPPKEIASTGLVLALYWGVLALLQAPSFVTPVPEILFALVAMTPILAFSLGSATFGRFLVEGLLRWRRQARKAVSNFAEENTDWIARSVQQDRVTILNQEIVPFFADVLRKDAIDEDDRQRAREISGVVRAVMVAEVDRSWLDVIVEHAGGRSVSDPDRIAEVMTPDQRIAMRAAIVAVVRQGAYEPGSLLVSLRLNRGICDVAVTAVLSTTENVLRGEIAPYVAVLRVVFDDLKAEFNETALTLRFSYEQR